MEIVPYFCLFYCDDFWESSQYANLENMQILMNLMCLVHKYTEFPIIQTGSREQPYDFF